MSYCWKSIDPKFDLAPWFKFEPVGTLFPCDVLLNIASFTLADVLKIKFFGRNSDYEQVEDFHLVIEASFMLTCKYFRYALSSLHPFTLYRNPILVASCRMFLYNLMDGVNFHRAKNARFPVEFNAGESCCIKERTIHHTLDFTELHHCIVSPDDLCNRSVANEICRSKPYDVIKRVYHRDGFYLNTDCVSYIGDPLFEYSSDKVTRAAYLYMPSNVHTTYYADSTGIVRRTLWISDKVLCNYLFIRLSDPSVQILRFFVPGKQLSLLALTAQDSYSCSRTDMILVDED